MKYHRKCFEASITNDLHRLFATERIEHKNSFLIFSGFHWPEEVISRSFILFSVEKVRNFYFLIVRFANDVKILQSCSGVSEERIFCRREMLCSYRAFLSMKK